MLWNCRSQAQNVANGAKRGKSGFTVQDINPSPHQGCVRVISKMFDISNQSQQATGFRGSEAK
jgi:hypothetical protein